MKNHHVQLEVLLMTDTTFASGNLAEKKDPRPQDQLTEEERMEEACWNGLLQTMLPEIAMKPAAGTGTLYLWQIKATARFLELELGEVPAKIDGHYSITPHSFLGKQCFS
jgi:hypothetical protein